MKTNLAKNGFLNKNHNANPRTCFKKRFNESKELLLLLLPILIYYIIFHYIPLYGIVIAFQDYTPGLGILKSDWVGFKWFVQFFKSIYFFRLLRNTLLLNIYGLIFGFPMPIIFALLLSEIKDGLYKKTVQTVSYLPHFVSLVVVVGIIVNFLSPVDGFINNILLNFNIGPINFLNETRWFRTIYISSGIWQGFGWGSIIYLAALSGVDPNLYEASDIDGAGRFKKIIHIKIPSIMPTITILLILNMGNMLSVGFEKIILLYNPATFEVADVISTYVYRRGILQSDFSFSSAVGLFNSVANFILLITFNKISRKITEIGLW